MHKLSILSLVAALLILSACASMDSSTGKSRYTKIDVIAAKALFDRDVLFIDLRTKVSYDRGHIPGAVNLTWGQKFSPARLAKVASKTQEVVFYCYGIHCEISANATDRAVAWGYKNVYYFMKGFPAWWDADYPIE